MVNLVGIDEARRGPLLGSMVICGVLVEENKEKDLKEIGVKDSKLLTMKQKINLFPEILKIIKKYKAIIISPKEIDDALTSEESNLNKLEAVKSAMIINYLKPDKVILDCPSVNIPAYVDYLKTFLKHKTKIKAEHKAEIHPSVAAASILAKVIAEQELAKLKKKYNVEFGSGYPSDPKTKEFLKNNYKKYDFFRKTWVPYKRIAEKKKQKSLADY